MDLPSAFAPATDTATGNGSNVKWLIYTVGMTTEGDRSRCFLKTVFKPEFQGSIPPAQSEIDNMAKFRGYLEEMTRQRQQLSGGSHRNPHVYCPEDPASRAYAERCVKWDCQCASSRMRHDGVTFNWDLVIDTDAMDALPYTDAGGSLRYPDNYSQQVRDWWAWQQGESTKSIGRSLW